MVATLLSFIASVGAFDQYKIIRAVQDAFPETAVSDRAIYAASDFLGIRIPRKSPASATATLTSSLSLTVPAFSQFQGANSYFFNRDAFTVVASVPVTVTLTEGEVLRKSITGLGSDYQLYVSPENAFSVSDVDVAVKIGKTVIPRNSTGLWNLKLAPGFYDRTMPDGRLCIQFGTDYFGTSPSTSDTILVTYTTTMGSLGNDLDLVSKTIFCDNFPTLQGAFTTAPSGGTNERPALVFKNVNAPSFGTFSSAVTKQQHLTSAADFPGVIDALTFAQRETNPNALEWMNLIKVVLLTSTIWNQIQKDAFIAQMQSRCMYSTRFFLVDPTTVSIDISVNLFCYNWANATQIKQDITTALTTLMKPRAGSLNYPLYRSDIFRTIKETSEGVEYFDIKLPDSDVYIGGLPASAPSLILTAAAGSFPGVATVTYGVSVTTAYGIVAIREWTSAVTSPACAVTVTWPAVPGAVSYQLYGRDSSMGLLYSGTGLTYTDIGLSAPGAAPPPQDTAPVQYATLGTLTVNSTYSTRQSRN
jgi:hypothetical protein